MKKIKPVLIDGKHPLLAHLSAWTMPALAKATGIPVNTLYVYRLRAQKRKTWLVPAEFAATICKATCTPPHDLRPDLWLPGWDFCSEED